MRQQRPCNHRSRPTSDKQQPPDARRAQVAIAALFAAQDSLPAQPNGFELFGMDLLVDSCCRVWLLEVNSSPSMELDTPLDRQLKPALIRDVVRVVQPCGMDRGALQAALEGRLLGGRRRRTGGGVAGAAAGGRAAAAADVAAVLAGGLPRPYGQAPAECGGFQCIAPSPFYRRLQRLKSGGG
jgi:hypothetical protein